VKKSGIRPCALSVCVSAALLAFCLCLAATAGAAQQREFESQITAVPAIGPHGEAVPLPGKLSGVNSLAVSGSSLYAAEVLEGQSESRIDGFDAQSGAFEAQFPQPAGLERFLQGIAVGAATGATQIYAGAALSADGEGAMGVFDGAGDLLSSWEGAKTAGGSFGPHGVSSVAVDESASAGWADGVVYVADFQTDSIYAFDPTEAAVPGEETAPLLELDEREPGVPFEFGEITEPVIAVNPQNGDLLVADGGDSVDVFEPTGTDELTLVDRILSTPNGPLGRVTALAADASTGEIYVADREAGLLYGFDAAGAYLTQIGGTPTGPFSSLRGLAIDPASGRLFVGDARRNSGVIDVFGPAVTVPDVTTAPATDVGAVEATLHGTVDPLGTGEASCSFAWGTTPKLEHVLPCPGPVAEGASPVPVSATLFGLAPDTTYFFRLQARGAGGPANLGESSQDREFTTSGPGILSASVAEVTAGSARFLATIDPHGKPTSFFVEYGTADCADAPQSCQALPASPGVSLGAGEGDLAVPPQLATGLAPATTYHYRVVVLSELSPGTIGEFAGPDQTFVTQGAAIVGLLDGRGWELVSQVDKHGGKLEPIGNGALVQAAAGGGAVSYAANAPTEAEPPGSANLVQILGARGAGGWASRDIALPHETPTGPAVGAQGEYRAFSGDLSESVVQPFGLLDRLLSPEADEPTPYLARSGAGANLAEPCTVRCFRPLVTAQNTPAGSAFGKQNCEGDHADLICGPVFVGASADLRHIVVQASAPLSEGGPAGAPGGLYEWSDGRIAPVSVLPAEEGEGGIPARLGYESKVARQAISEDGSRVIWEAEPGGVRHLYLRDLSAGASGETVRLDLARPGSPAGGEDAPLFQGASSDDSRIFFTDSADLTEDSGAGSQRPDLYECKVTDGPGGLACELTDLTPLTASEESADVQGLLPGISAGGEYVYFVADGALTPGAEQGDCENGFTAGASCALYLYHDGSTKLVTTLSGLDSPDWAKGSPDLTQLTVRVSPNGHWLAFMSRRSLTGFDNSDRSSGEPDEEVYLYDATADGGAGRLVCASCAGSGSRPEGVEYGPIGEKMPLVGTAKIWEAEDWFAAAIPGWTAYTTETTRYQSRYLSDSGRLFFNSDTPLAAGDVNGTWDVYEYEPPEGEGQPASNNCDTTSPAYNPAAAGCIGLVSSGTGREESAFLDASESGDDVFFLTGARLAPRDTDSALDVYDARVGGGEAEGPTGNPCSGEACQPSAGAPAESTPGSLAFTGPGNPVQCRKGQVKKAGKCVKKKANKKQHHGKAKHKKKRHHQAKKPNGGGGSRRGTR
jgi:DNA-binding beta-propeller fold protein YncE